jgi:hypothetical protein
MQLPELYRPTNLTIIAPGRRIESNRFTFARSMAESTPNE